MRSSLSPFFLCLLEMSGLSFHIASLDESGVLNVWVSGTRRHCPLHSQVLGAECVAVGERAARAT